MRQRLVRRLRSLWTVELLNAVVIFPALILELWQSFQIGGFTGLHPDDRLVGAGMGVLALLEYLNYFHVQLSYDNQADVRHLLRQRRLKRGIIARTFGW
jgi:hypothetical protein